MTKPSADNPHRRAGRSALLMIGAFLAASCGQGEHVETASRDLVGGQLPAANEFTTTVWYQMTQSGWNGAQTCSGTKIGPRLILTAAHCVSGRTRNYLLSTGELPDITFMHAGEPIWITNANDTSGFMIPAQQFAVVRTIYPDVWKEACEEHLVRYPTRLNCSVIPNYPSSLAVPDLALIEVDADISGVETAQVDFRPVAGGDAVLAVGYGQRATRLVKSQYPNIDPSWVIREETTNGIEYIWIAAPADVADPWLRYRRFDRQQVSSVVFGGTFGNAVSFTTFCPQADFFNEMCALHHAGDSGSPLYRESADNGLAVVGVHSSGGRYPNSHSFHFRTSGADLKSMLDRASYRPIGEIGRIQADQAGTAWSLQQLRDEYANPVIVTNALSFNGSHPSHLRVRNAASSSFDWKIEEWAYLDGNHTTEINPYIVLEAGTHRLEDGRAALAAIVSTTHQWTTVPFGGNFSTAPVVLVGVMSDNETAPVIVRMRNLTATSVEIKLDEEESADRVHAPESVGLIAIEAGSGANNGRLVVAATTADTVTHRWSTVSFSPWTLANPVFLANMTTTDGGDTSSVRFRNLSDTQVQVKVEEETSRDSEKSHTTERIGWVAFEGPGVILGQ